MYNVLHIMAGADAGGISTVVLNYYRLLDRTKIHFDVAVTTDMLGQNALEMERLGVRFYRLPLKSKGIKAYELALKEILNKGCYQAIHVHENETSYIALRTAKRMGISQRIAHAHTASPTTSLKGELKRVSGCVLNNYYATDLIGCGQLAGEKIFGKRNMRRSKACVLPNAIDVELFKFDNQVRDEIRSDLNIESKFVVGMVGRLSAQKNYEKALEIMEKYHKNNPDVVLLCVGNGELEQEIKELISRKGMAGYTRLLGRRSDVNRLYMGFDVLLMPSKYEGFPVAAVEAIGAGLPVLLSDTITKELKSCKNTYYLPLTDDDKWLNQLAFLEKSKIADRTSGVDELKKNDLDIVSMVNRLEDIYLKFWKRENK